MGGVTGARVIWYALMSFVVVIPVVVDPMLHPQDPAHHMLATDLPLPPQIYDRMSWEINESPRLKAEARKKMDSVEASRKTAAEIEEQLRNMDGFEGHLRALNRAKLRGRSLREANSTAGLDEDDE